MKAFLTAAAIALSSPLAIHAQVVPTTPTKFTTRGIGDSSSSSGVGVATVKPQVATRQITHIILGEPRQWKLVDGKSFVGKLIAFEDVVVEVQKDASPVAAPVVPPKPTLVKNGNARFLVNSKPYELPMARLGADEWKFIEETSAAIAVKK